MFDLELPGLTATLGQDLEHAVADAGAWPVRFTPGREERRWFGLRKSYPTVLEILTADGQGHVLIDPDTWDEHAWRFRPDAIERLARLVTILAEHVPDGFTFRATWAGSPIERTEHLSPDELVARIEREQVNDHTRYAVEPSAPEA